MAWSYIWCQGAESSEKMGEPEPKVGWSLVSLGLCFVFWGGMGGCLFFVPVMMETCRSVKELRRGWTCTPQSCSITLRPF